MVSNKHRQDQSDDKTGASIGGGLTMTTMSKDISRKPPTGQQQQQHWRTSSKENAPQRRNLASSSLQLGALASRSSHELWGDFEQDQGSEYGFLPARRNMGNFEHQSQHQTTTSSPNSSFINRNPEIPQRSENEFDRSQDDSHVFKESPSKKLGTKLKQQRRGESFNLKNIGPVGPTWNSTDQVSASSPSSTPTKRKWSFKKFAFGKNKSSSTTNNTTPSIEQQHQQIQQYYQQNPQQYQNQQHYHNIKDLYQNDINTSTTSQINIINSIDDDGGGGGGRAGEDSRGSVVGGSEHTHTGSQSDLGSDFQLSGAYNSRPQIMQSTPALHHFSNESSSPQQQQQQQHSSSINPTMPHSTSWQPGGGGRDHRKPFASQSTSSLDYSNNNSADNSASSNNNNKENDHPSGYRSVFEYKLSQINKSYSSSAIRPPTTPGYNSSKQEALERRWRSNNYENVPINAKNLTSPTSDQFSSNGNSSARTSSHSSHIENIEQYSDINNRVKSPDGKNNIEAGDSIASWTESSQSLNEGNSKHSSSRLYQQPRSFNPHLEGVTPRDVKRQLEENRLKSPKDPPSARLPMMAKADSVSDMGASKNRFQFDTENIEKLTSSSNPVYSSSGKLGNSLHHHQDEEVLKEVEMREIATSPLPPMSPSGNNLLKNHPSPETTPPQFSPPQPSSTKDNNKRDSSLLTDMSWNVVNTPGASYMCIVRQRPCYNTSTQTEAAPAAPPPEPSHPAPIYGLKSPSEPALRNAEVQAGRPAVSASGPVKTRLLKEERGIQARPGSIVAANMAVNSKSVAVGSGDEGELNGSTAQWEGGDHGHKTITPTSKAVAVEQHKDRDVKPKSPKGSIVSSTSQQQQYHIHADDLAKIQDNSPNDTAMIRKLSQEYFSQRKSSTNRHSANLEDELHRQSRKLSDVGSSTNSGTSSGHAREKSGENKSFGSASIESKVSTATKNTLLEMRKDIESYERQENMSKSRGSVNSSGDYDIVNSKKEKKFVLKQANLLNKFNVEHQQRQLSSKSQDVLSSGDNTVVEKRHVSDGSYANSSDMDTHKIAEQARKEWIQSGKFQEYGGPKVLKKTVSEQVRPLSSGGAKEKSSMQNKDISTNSKKSVKSRKFSTPSEFSGGIIEKKPHKTSDPSSDQNKSRTKKSEHSYQTSDPTQDSKLSSRYNHEHRLSSDSDAVFRGPVSERKSRPNSNISNRSSSSGSTGIDDRSGTRISDPDLKKLQQKAVMNFFEKKTGKRSSSSSMDSSICSELSTPKDTSKDWRLQKSPSSPFKPNEPGVDSIISSSSTSAKQHLKKMNTPPHNLDLSSVQHRLRNAATSSSNSRHKDITSAELSPPPLLDTSSIIGSSNTTSGIHSYSSSSATTASLSSPLGDPHSPPLHPWPAEMTGAGVQGTEEEETDVKLRLSSAKQSSESKSEDRSKGANQNKSANETTKALQYSTSSTESSPPGITNATNSSSSSGGGGGLHDHSSKFTYNQQLISSNANMNRSYLPDEEDNNPAPSLPPRNYRSNYNPGSGRQVPQPMEPPSSSTSSSSSGMNRQSSSGPDSLRTSEQNSARNSSSSFTEVFPSDTEATPARDSYADQLRMQSRRISQTQTSYLNAARYNQHRSVGGELKTNVAVSRPVEKPSVGKTQPVTSTSSVISNNSNKDYNGLSMDGGSGFVDAGLQQHSPTSRNSARNSINSDGGIGGGRYSFGSANELPIIGKGGYNNKSRGRLSLGSQSDFNAGNRSNNEGRYSISSAGELSNRLGSNSNIHHSPQGSDLSNGRGNNTSLIHHSPQGSNSSDRGGVYLNPIASSPSLNNTPNRQNNNQSPSHLHYHHHQSRQDSVQTFSSPPNSHNGSVNTSLENLPTPPPPPPPHQPYHSPSSSLLEDKPLPPLPPAEMDDGAGEGEFPPPPPPPGSSAEDADSQNRFSSDSYISNKNNYRQAYSGNYHRSVELSGPPEPQQQYHTTTAYEQQQRISPSSINHNSYTTTPTGRKTGSNNNNEDSSISPSINPPKNETMVHVTKVLKVNNYIVSPSGEGRDNSSSSEKQRSDISPPWSGGSGNRGYTPTQQTFVNSRHHHNSTSTMMDESLASRLADEESNSQPSQSPSVKSFVANFEVHHTQKHGSDRAAPVTSSRGKVSEIRETLLRNSNENLSTSEMEELQMHPRSRSNSRENILVVNNQVGDNSRPVVKMVSSMEDLSTTTTRSHPMDSNQYSDGNNTRIEAVVPDIQECRQARRHHQRDRSDPQSDGDTRSNDSGVAEDINSHIRQKSQEEIDCEKQALIVASQLREQDKHLSKVILPPAEHKSSMDYVSGLFDTKVNVTHKTTVRSGSSVNSNASRARSDSLKSKSSSSLPSKEETPNKSDINNVALPAHSPYWSPPSLANLQNKMREEGMNADDILKDVTSTGTTLESEMKVLISRIEKKIEILKEEKTFLEDEIQENEALGAELEAIVEQKISSPAEQNKYRLYVSELAKVIILLLKLSERLARAENGILSLGDESSEKEKSTLKAKRQELQDKLEDAKLLKDGIDRRSKQVSVFLQRSLTGDEYEDYLHFIKMKSKLIVDQQEIDDKLKLGDGQLTALKKSMNLTDC